MGLDMYLEAEIYLFQEKVEIKGIDTHDLTPKRITFKLGYWRKANAIHNWFVENVQEGDDDCGKYFVPRDKLKELKKKCKKILNSVEIEEGKVHTGTVITKDKIEENFEKGEVIVNTEICEKVLPTRSGFFFGNTAYNEYYLTNVRETIKIIDKALGLPKKFTIYYRSSW